LNLKKIVKTADEDFWIRTFIYLFLILILSFKFSFYFTASPLTGWDTVGHSHQAKKYADLFSGFSSTGYDYGWFQGFPAFYFYPQFFYFLTGNINMILHNLDLSFNLTILFVIIFFSVCYLKFTFFIFRNFTDKYFSYIFALSGLFFYLGYPGEGTQGLSVVGIINGTFISTLGHGMILLGLYYLEKYRDGNNTGDFVKAVVVSSLIFYTHFLSIIFYCILLSFYFFFFRKEFTLLKITVLAAVTSILSFPILFTFFRYGAFTDSISISNYYPGILSILGYDYFNIVSNPKKSFFDILFSVILNFKFLNIFLIVLFFAGLYFIFTNKIKDRYFIFLAFSCVLFFLFSMDTSFVFIFSFLKIHWYRAYDVFFIFFTVLVFVSFDHLLNILPEKKYNYYIAGGLLLVIQFGFYLWNPLKADKYESIKFADYTRNNMEYEALDSYLSGIKKDSLVMPEYLGTSDYYGSPHWLDYPIQRNGLRNAFGLMIESSLTPKLTLAYMPSENTDMFIWGIDSSWKGLLYKNSYSDDKLRYDSFVRYLKDSGINYVITQSGKFRAFLRTYGDDLEESLALDRISVFKVIKSTAVINTLASKPYGFIDYDYVNESGTSREVLYKNYLLYSNQTKVLIDKNMTLINLTPFMNESGFRNLLPDYVSGLVIYNSSDKAVNDYLAEKIAEPGLPMILVNFKKTGYMKEKAVYISTNVGTPVPSDATSDNGGIRDTERIALTDYRINGDKIVINGIGGSGKSGGSNKSGNIPVEIKFSFFPDWKAKDSRLFQTDTNQMIVFSDKDSIEVDFFASFAGIITGMLYFLISVFFVVSIFHRSGKTFPGLLRGLKFLRGSDG
jgi:hypothetical protein